MQAELQSQIEEETRKINKVEQQAEEEINGMPDVEVETDQSSNSAGGTESNSRTNEVAEVAEIAEYKGVKIGLTDHQGNPVNADGSLLVEKVKSIDELSDEDFVNPTRNVQLPTLPKRVDAAIGANGKPIVIKKNIFEKNKKSHEDLSPNQSRQILSEALYSPNLYGQNQKTKRPYNWILIHNADKHSSVILEVNHQKDNVEIVNWHYLNNAKLKQKEKQAIAEGGLILTLESVAGNTHNDLYFTDKGSENTQDNKDYLPKNAKVDKQQEEKQKVKHHKAIAQNRVSLKEVAVRDAIVDIVRESRIEVGTNNEDAQRLLDWANDVRLMSFGEDYDKYLDGRVEPGLSDKIVHIESAKLNHGFTNFDEAREWAKKHIVRTLNNEQSGGKGNVGISINAVKKYLSKSAVTKSESKDVHLAVLTKLHEIIHDSIDVETTPDFEKDKNGVRKPGNKINKNILIHRCYGAVEIDGNIYRVKITLKEYKDASKNNKAYSYEATKIELLAGTLVGENKSSNPGTNNSISATKLLKDVEMSYNQGVKVLEESEKRSESISEHRVYHGSGVEFDAFDHSNMGEGEGAQAYGWGTYVTEVEGIGRMYASTGGVQLKISELESNISRAKEKLPFMPPSDIKTETEEEIKK